MWPFKKTPWTVIGYADLDWVELNMNRLKDMDKTMRVIFKQRGDQRHVHAMNHKAYMNCLNCSVCVFTECAAWEAGGPLPSTFQRMPSAYTKTDNVIHLKAKE
jgi:hypothetical protein